MSNFEMQYERLVNKILKHGEFKEGRNGRTKSIFGECLTINLDDGFPLLSGRRIFYTGVFGELAAMLKGPKHIEDFEKYGCNYWKLWAKEDGSIEIDYGNKWLDWDGYNQLETLVENLKYNPNDRRLLVTGWDPRVLYALDLPCCHYAYQWYVRDNEYLDMLWHQRSADTMIGLPSDIVFASAWNIILAREVGLKPGIVKLTLGDTHIYEEHFKGAEEYLQVTKSYTLPEWLYFGKSGESHTEFTPDKLAILDYHPNEAIKFKLKV